MTVPNPGQPTQADHKGSEVKLGPAPPAKTAGCADGFADQAGVERLASAVASLSPGVANEPLAAVLDRNSTVGHLWQAEDGRVRCLACGHRCLLAPGGRGICKVRFNREGQLRVPFGYVAGVACDPVEKKPFFHVVPGSDALTFGMLGCNFHCAFCQNWVSSQALRDPAAVAPIQVASPEQLVEAARREGARLVVSSYNEPLITAEWAAAVFARAKAAGLLCACVSNGHATPEVLDFLQPWLSAFKVDLKTFNERQYRTLGGTLARVTDSIQQAHRRGIWVEVVTLLVPGFNDSEPELREMAGFLASVSCDLPWHVTAFHPNYRLHEPPATSPRDLVRAAEIGRAEGLRFVYAGNLSGRVGDGENTRCPGCGESLIERCGFSVRRYRLTAAGGCPRCGQAIPGRWSAEGVSTAGHGGPGPFARNRAPGRTAGKEEDLHEL
jgi:pyruvate formate lyase activating enzyme